MMMTTKKKNDSVLSIPVLEDVLINKLLPLLFNLSFVASCSSRRCL